MIKEKLEDKWGTFTKVGHYYEQCPMPFVSDNARLNVFFEPENVDIVKAEFEKYFCQPILPELLEFYKKWNGCRLFFGSLSVFGLQKHSQEIYEPFDIILENQRILAQMKKSDRANNHYIYFASLGGDYVFGYNPEELSKVYTFQIRSVEVLKEYEDFNLFFNIYFEKLYDEYDENGKKKHINTDFSGIPALEHITNDIDMFI